MTSKAVILERRAEQLEEAIVEVLYSGDKFTLTGATIYDLRNRRLGLLHAARRYGEALRRFREKV